MYKLKEKKGITLIALIITIIVLLILAVTAIGAIQESKIIEHATNTTDKHVIGSEKEQIQLAYNSYKIDKYAPPGRTADQDGLEKFFLGGNDKNGVSVYSLIDKEKSTNDIYIVNYNGEEIKSKFSEATFNDDTNEIDLYFMYNGNKYKLTVENTKVAMTKKLEAIKSEPKLEIEGAEVVENKNKGWNITFNETGRKYKLYTNGEIKQIETVINNPEPIIHVGVIPKGGVYKRIAEDGTETEYTAGQNFPEEVLDGDIYIYGDYEYRYNRIWYENWMDMTTANSTLGVELSDGWGVRVIDSTKDEYKAMITTINGEDVTNVVMTFAICENLETIPQLSNATKDMTWAFGGCTSLTTVSYLPDSVVNMKNTFWGCSLLATVSYLPANVVDLRSTFDQCYSLVTVPAIPSNVTNMERTFCCCESLVIPPDMSQAVNVTNMKDTFHTCRKMETAPVIPSTVTNMMSTFAKCEALTGEIIINANPTTYNGCFAERHLPIIIIGNASEATKQALAAMGSNISWE